MKKQADNFSKRARSQFSDFAKKVVTIVAKIPKGKTMTYGQVATKAGNPRAARAVGTLMSRNYNPKIPCHRVVRADGSVGNYNRGGAERKAEMLFEEGVR
ncbi:MAG: MGMT family protein [Patescibacteria group bacterium]|nr:MGMT family protein [Patescibacteria group bacterium]